MRTPQESACSGPTMPSAKCQVPDARCEVRTPKSRVRRPRSPRLRERLARAVGFRTHIVQHGILTNAGARTQPKFVGGHVMDASEDPTEATLLRRRRK